VLGQLDSSASKTALTVLGSEHFCQFGKKRDSSETRRFFESKAIWQEQVGLAKQAFSRLKLRPLRMKDKVSSERPHSLAFLTHTRNTCAAQFCTFLFSLSDWHLAAAWSLTVALLVFVLVMVWHCWNLPPVPAIRFWALGFAGMSANFLDQFWRAEAWKKECEKLELKLQGRRLLPRPKITSTVGDKGTVGVVDCFAPLRIGTGFPPATTPFDLHIETSDFLGLSKGAIAQQNIGNIPSPFLCLVERGVLVPSLLLLPKMTLYQTTSRYITNLLWCNPSALFPVCFLLGTVR
jgi:hypothetical protein